MEYLISLSKIQSDRIEINNIFARYHNIKGTRSADNGKIKEALREFNQAIELNPGFLSAYFNRGTIKADLGDFEGAKADFERVKELERHLIPASGNVFNLRYNQV